MEVEDFKKAILEITPKYPIKRVTLFGSYASGSSHEGSDVDFIMEFSQPISLLTLSAIKIRLEEILNLSVDIVHGPIQSTDFLEIEEEIELYAA